MPRDREAVRHSRDEITNRAKLLRMATAPLPGFGQKRWIGAVRRGKVCNDPQRLVPNRIERRTVVKSRVEILLQFSLLARKRA